MFMRPLPPSEDDAFFALHPLEQVRITAARVSANDPTLQCCTISDTSIVGTGLELLSEGLVRNTFVRDLVLAGCGLTGETGGLIVRSITRSVSEARGRVALRHLDLSRNSEIDDTVGELLLQCVRVHPTLRTVNVDGTGISAALAARIARLCEMQRFPAPLKRLAAEIWDAALHDVSGTASKVERIVLTDDDADPRVYCAASVGVVLCDLLPLAPNTRVLGLDGCCAGDRALSVLSDAFARGDARLCNITHLWLRSNRLGNDAVLALCDAIHKCPQPTALAELALENNQFDDVGVSALAELTASPNARQLSRVLIDSARGSVAPKNGNNHNGNDAAGNGGAASISNHGGQPSISETAAEKLAAGAAVNAEAPLLKDIGPRLHANDPAITEVVLRGSGDGEGSVAAALSHRHRRGSYFSDGRPMRTHLTNVGLRALVVALQQNTHVHTLDLRDNMISADGARVLGQHLQHNPYITAVDLRGNSTLDAEAARHLINAASRNDALVSLRVDEGCNVPPSMVEVINAACRLNAHPVPLKALLRAAERQAGGSEVAAQVAKNRATAAAGPSAIGLSPQSTPASGPSDVVAGQPATVSTVLDLSARPQPLGKRTSIDLSAIALIYRILQFCPQVEEVDLSGNDLSSANPGAAEAVARLLVEADHPFRRLRLISTNFNDAAAERLQIALLMHNNHLTSLHLAGNPSLSLKAAGALEDAMRLNLGPRDLKRALPLIARDDEAVTAVLVSSSADRTSDAPAPSGGKAEPIGDDGCRVVCTALTTNTVVTSLRLVGQGLSDHCTTALCSCLAVHPALTCVDLSRNMLADRAALAIAELLGEDHSAPALQALDLSGNLFSDNGVLSICGALDRSRLGASARVRLQTINVAGSPHLTNPTACARAIALRLLWGRTPHEFQAAYGGALETTCEAAIGARHAQLHIAALGELSVMKTRFAWFHPEITFSSGAARLTDDALAALSGALHEQALYCRAFAASVDAAAVGAVRPSPGESVCASASIISTTDDRVTLVNAGPAVQRMSLQGHSFTAKGIEQLVSILSLLTKCTDVDLTRTDFSSDPNGPEAVGEVLVEVALRCPHVTRIDVDCEALLATPQWVRVEETLRANRASPRLRQIWLNLLEGRTNPQAADRLDVSGGTTVDDDSLELVLRRMCPVPLSLGDAETTLRAAVLASCETHGISITPSIARDASLDDIFAHVGAQDDIDVAPVAIACRAVGAAFDSLVAAASPRVTATTVATTFQTPTATTAVTFARGRELLRHLDGESVPQSSPSGVVSVPDGGVVKALRGLRVIDLARNGQVTMVGMLYMCVWAAVAAPALRCVRVEDMHLSAPMVAALRSCVTTTTSGITEVTPLTPTATAALAETAGSGANAVRRLQAANNIAAAGADTSKGSESSSASAAPIARVRLVVDFTTSPLPPVDASTPVATSADIVACPAAPQSGSETLTGDGPLWATLRDDIVHACRARALQEAERAANTQRRRNVAEIAAEERLGNHVYSWRVVEGDASVRAELRQAEELLATEALREMPERVSWRERRQRRAEAAGKDHFTSS